MLASIVFPTPELGSRAGGCVLPQIVYLASSEGSSRGCLCGGARVLVLHKAHQWPTRCPRDPSSRLHSSQLSPQLTSGLLLPDSTARVLPGKSAHKLSNHVPYLIHPLHPSPPAHPGQHFPLTQTQSQPWRSSSLLPMGRSGPSPWASLSTGSLSSRAMSRRSPP